MGSPTQKSSSMSTAPIAAALRSRYGNHYECLQHLLIRSIGVPNGSGSTLPRTRVQLHQYYQHDSRHYIQCSLLGLQRNLCPGQVNNTSLTPGFNPLLTGISGILEPIAHLNCSTPLRSHVVIARSDTSRWLCNYRNTARRLLSVQLFRRL